MSRNKTGIAKRAFAAVGAGAIALAGVVGLSTAAFADDAAPAANWGNIDLAAKGSLEINKRVGSADKNIPLGGIKFNIEQCESFDPSDPADWNAVGTWNAAEDCHDLGTMSSGTTDATGKVTFDELAVGAYWVTEDQTSLPAGVTGSVSFWVVIPYPGAGGWEYNVVVYPKNTIEGEGSKTADTVDGLRDGAIVDWTLTSPVFGSADLPASSTSVEVTDKYGAYQKYVTNSAKLYTVAPGTTTEVVVAGQPAVTDGTNQVTFTYDLTGTSYPAGTKFVIKYQTEILTLPENGEIKNDTPWGWDATYWGSFTGLKVSTDGTKLDGAEFAIYEGACEPSSSAVTVRTVTSGPDGKIDSGQLFVAKGKANANAAKDYCLVETKAPAGFVPLTAGIDVTLEAGGGEKATVIDNVVNTAVEGPGLPVTGASGTMLMTIGGLGLVAIAGGLYLATRRKAHQE